MPAHQNPPPPDPHRVLGVPRDATPAEIRTAYRALLLALHPDTRAEPSDPARLAQVVAAHAQLRDARRGDTAPTTSPGATGIPVRIRRPRGDTSDPAAAGTPSVAGGIAPAPTPPDATGIPIRVRRARREPPDIRVGPVRAHRSR
ncbi:J domain-containing protein [Lentzea sp. NPDC004789]